MNRHAVHAESSTCVVVVFDICSSTVILENLIHLQKRKRWIRLLTHLNDFLANEAKSVPFEVYKFLGDGWILLFDEDANGLQIMRFLKRLCEHYETLFKPIAEVLNTSVPVGLMFGTDRGPLLCVHMNGQSEYIGRALNVASRLQGAIVQKDKRPAGKLLISKNAYADLGLGATEFEGKLVKRTLAKVAGGEAYEARKITIREPTK
jgi:class 3 adenylate cyclase